MNDTLLKIIVLLVTAPWWFPVVHAIATEIWRSGDEPEYLELRDHRPAAVAALRDSGRRLLGSRKRRGKGTSTWARTGTSWMTSRPVNSRWQTGRNVNARPRNDRFDRRPGRYTRRAMGGSWTGGFGRKGL